MDGIALQRTGVDSLDENNHLAKVRVGGSNPVVRSKRFQIHPVRGLTSGPAWRIRNRRALSSCYIC